MLDELYVIDKIILVKSSNVGKMLKFAILDCYCYFRY